MIHERQLAGATDPRALQPPLVLVADEDEAIRDLLHLAFSSHHWRVITAADGDEALQRALAERPDVVVLAHPLPRKSGIEVCDYLRHDPDDPSVPVLLITSTADPQLRLEALQRGADDVIAKPFSPRELLARGRRLLVRAQDARRLRREVRELERELARVREAGRRAAGERDRERELRALATGAGAGLFERASESAVASGLLRTARNLTGAAGAVMFTREPGAGADACAWRASASAGPSGPRLAALDPALLEALPPPLFAAARARSRHELERTPHVGPRAAWASAGVALFVPLVSAEGTEGALLLAERADGAPHAAPAHEALAVIASFAAGALRAARRQAAQASELIERAFEAAAREPRERAAAEECADVGVLAARALQVPSLDVVRHALAAGAWGWSEDGRRTLARLAALDASGRVRDVAELIAAGRAVEPPAHGVDPAAATLAAVAARAAIARAAGRSRDEAWATALAWCAADGDARALAGLRDVLGPMADVA